MNYEVKKVDGVYHVVDLCGFVVCQCTRQHNASLICYLLNQY